MDHAKEREGVVKYVFQHEPTRITPPPGFADLLVWRTRLRARQLIGADSDGLGYGNLSVRLYASPRFLISASQTSGREQVDLRHFTEVTVVDLDRNFLKCRGEIQASSEALTHAALYQADPSIRAVVHVHSQPVWERYRDQLPTTREDVAYGTPEMAYEMIRLHRRGAFGARGVVVMGGHRDGVIAFGPTLAGTAQEMLDLTGA